MSACLSLSQSLPPFHLSFNKDLWARRSIFTIFQPNNFAVSLLPIWKPRPRKVKETTHSPILRRGLTRVCLVSKYTFLPSHRTAPRTGWPKTTCLFSPGIPGTCPMGPWSYIISAEVEQRLQEERGRSSLETRREQKPQRCRSGLLADREPRWQWISLTLINLTVRNELLNHLCTS